MTYRAVYQSPLGPLWLTSDGENLTGLWMREVPGENSRADLPIFTDTFRWLDAYFRGERPPMGTLPLSPAGTAFQRLIRELLLTIPYGETRTYGQLAKEAARRLGKNKMSPQAVGGAVGRNPISIIIPCHRVIGAGGQLTGYAGGLDKKTWLLRHEEVIK